jgi:hypothetical protein
MMHRTAMRRYSAETIAANTRGDAGSAARQMVPGAILVLGCVAYSLYMQYKGPHRPVTETLCYHGAAGVRHL